MWYLKSLYDHCNSVSTEINGKWVPARPLVLTGMAGWFSRLRDAWMVFTGKADAFIWPCEQ